MDDSARLGQASELCEPSWLGAEPHQDILGERRHGRLLTRRQQTCAQFRTELQALELKAVRLMKGCYVVACCRQGTVAEFVLPGRGRRGPPES